MMNNNQEKLPIACTLSEAEQTAYREQYMQKLFGQVQQTSEIADGYEFRFPGEDTWADELLAYVKFERSCCAFLTFDLMFLPNQSEIILRIRGDEAVKAYLSQEFNLSPLAQT